MPNVRFIAHPKGLERANTPISAYILQDILGMIPDYPLTYVRLCVMRYGVEVVAYFNRGEETHFTYTEGRYIHNQEKRAKS